MTLEQQFWKRIPDLSGRNTMTESEPVFDNVMQALGAWWAREWPEAVLDAEALIRLDAMIRDEVKPDPNDDLPTELEMANAHISDLKDALQWCSGSADFGPGGQAREGWLKIEPLLSREVPA